MALIECHFRSEALHLSTSMTVILPQQPSDSIAPSTLGGPPRCQTLYLLHGLSDDHTVWLRRTSIERYVEPLGLAVVMPAVDRSFYTDMAAGNRYWTFISEELPALVQSFFPLSPAREDNFVAGLSMGGYGAFKLALLKPERFAAGASLSGAVDIVEVARSEEDEPWRPDKHAIFGDLDKVAGSEMDLFHQARRLMESNVKPPALYQWCGTEDFLYPMNVRFKQFADQIGLPVDYSEGPGDHQWMYWDLEIQRVLNWLPLRKPEG